MELPDVEAVKLAAKGDADAFMTLVRRYRAPLIGFITGKTWIRDEAEDIAQDVLCKAWEHLPRLREPEAFAGWLFKIAGNAILTSSRKRRTITLSEDLADFPEPSCDATIDVHAAVGKLPDEYRTAIMLRHFSGMSTDEVARALGVPAGTVRSRLSRAYARLREQLSYRVEV